MKTLLRRLFALLMCLILIPSARVNAELDQPGFSGSNINSQDYTRTASPVTSYLVPLSSGYMAVKAESGSMVRAAYYDADYVLQDVKEITDGLPLFGGFYAGTDGFYYIVTGQNNPDESADVECYRITKYDSNWNNLGSAGLYDCNTTIPFRAGSCRMADENGYLVVRTCHQMYKSSDGLNHQANVTIQVNTSSMTISDSYYIVMNVARGYVSHSFNQFVITDEDHIVGLDHGDAYPRSAVLIKYAKTISSGSFSGNTNYVDLITYAGEIGDNYTNATIGGLAVSSTHYLTVGNSTRQESTDQKTKNIYVTSSTRSDLTSDITWITNYAEDGTNYITAPHLIDLHNDTFMVLWSANGSYGRYDEADISWVIVNHEGKPMTDIYTQKGLLSDCAPFEQNGKVIWFIHESNNIAFEEIDLNTMELTSHQAKTKDWVDVESIELDEYDIRIAMGQSYTLNAKVLPENASIQNLTYQVEDTSIAYMSGTRVYPSAEGETVIHVYGDNGKSAECKVTVIPSHTGFRYSAPDTSMNVNETQQWNVHVQPDGLDQYIRFTSSDPSVISISDTGLITALKPGTAEVTAAYGTHKLSYTITVTAVNVTSITVTPEQAQLKPGDTLQLKAEVKPGNATDQTVTWTSSDSSIVKTDDTGFITALKEGTAVITAANPASGLKAECRITVKNHTHSWKLTEWQWTDDYSSAKASFVCEEDSSHTLTLAAEITKETVNPTCTEQGSITYTATVTNDGKTYTDTKKVVLEKLDHAWVFKGFRWADDYSAAYADFECEHDSSHGFTLSADITKKETKATCTEDGQIVYTASVTYEGKTYTDSRTQILEKTGHSYQLSSWNWSEDYTEAEAVFVCEHDASHTETVKADITKETEEPTCTEEGKIIYTASAVFEGKTYTDSKQTVLDKLEHIWVFKGFRWEDDYSAVYTDFECERDSSHGFTLPAELTKEETKATCTEDGQIVYTAAVTYEGKTYTDSRTQILEKTGHSWKLSRWNWSDDYTEAEAVFVCEHDASHIETVRADVTSDGRKATATVTFEGKIYSDTRNIGEPVPQSIKLNRYEATVKTQSTLKLTASIEPADADQSVTWTSSDENVAEVDQNGTVTAHRYGSVTITASSVSAPYLQASCTINTLFYDVADSSKYYFKPVYWAADENITTGYDKVYFGPQRNCTRRELCIFLYRLMGKPHIDGKVPFSDLKDKYAFWSDSYRAILWCQTNGIVKGYSDGTFRPDAPVIRKDVMIMLYRLAGKPNVSGSMKFPDVRALGYGTNTDTYKSIIWGTQNGITKGYSDGNFQPLSNCLREHIVTFIYRYAQQ